MDKELEQVLTIVPKISRDRSLDKAFNSPTTTTLGLRSILTTHRNDTNINLKIIYRIIHGDYIKLYIYHIL